MKQEGHRSATEMRKMSDKFKKKLDKDVVRDRSVKQERPPSKESKLSKNTKVAARK
jgi:hypothetical protein